jgi:tRNA pseudouridine32 synthase/23S rRNA pseudouridine746 synthase
MGFLDRARDSGRDGGKMIGVLVGTERESGRARTLKAFSGQLFGTWRVDGWAPPVGLLTHDSARYKTEHAKIKALSDALGEIERREKILREDVRERATKNDADVARAAARAKEKRARRREMRARLDARDENAALADVDLEALEDESRASKRELAELKRARDAALAPTLRALAECQTRARELKSQRKSLSRALQDEIWDSYRLPSLAGDVKPLREVFYPPVDASAPPAGCGDCAAPKLLAHARALDIVPHSIAEFWLGAESPREFRVFAPDAYYGACRDKCHPILGHLLCDRRGSG